MKRPPVLVLVMLLSGVLFASESQWQERLDEGHAAWANGDIAESALALEAALELAEGFGQNDPRLAQTLNDLAVAYTQLGRLEEARTLLARAIVIREATQLTVETAESLDNVATADFTEGDYVAAAQNLERAVAIVASMQDPDAALHARLLGKLGTMYHYQGRYEDAVKVFDQALEMQQARLPPGDPVIAEALLNRGEIHSVLGEYDAAESMFVRALHILEKHHGENAPELMVALNNLGALYYYQSRYDEAVALFLRGVGIVEAHSGDSLDLAQLLFNLGGIYETLSRFDDAEAAYTRALHIRETQAGAQHPLVADSLNNLGALYLVQGRYPEALEALQRALELHIAAHGEVHPYVADDLNNLAVYYKHIGDYERAEQTFVKVADLKRQLLGETHWEVAVVLSNLGGLQQSAGYYDAAEQSQREAVEILEAALGLDHPTLAMGLNNLATVYESQGRFEEAAPLLERALSINEAAYGEEHIEIADNLNNLGLTYLRLGRPEAARDILQRAVAIRETLIGVDDPALIYPHSNLGGTLELLGDYEAALVHYERAFALAKSSYGEDHALAGMAANNVAELHVTRGELEEPVVLHQQALEIRRKALGSSHPATMESLNNLGNLHELRGEYELALEYLRQALAAYRTLQARGGRGTLAATSLSGQSAATLVSNYVAVAHALLQKNGDGNLASEAFEAAQLTTAEGAVAALNSMGARFAAGDDALAGAVRERQDAVERWRALNRELVRVVSRSPENRDLEAEERTRTELQGVEQRIAELDERLDTEFPEYGELANPAPLSTKTASELLDPGEVLLSYFVGFDYVAAWVVSKDDVQLLRLDLSPEELEERIRALRLRLDPSALAGRMPVYPLEAAHELYKLVFAPLETHFKDVDTVLVVPDGPLESLPFAVFVHDAPGVGAESDYANAHWLVNRYAFATLPSVSSLRALRRFARATRAGKPFVGFGDPVLEGTGEERGVSMQTVVTRSSIADVRGVRALPALPETANELRSIAETLEAGEDDVYLRGAASETRVKTMDLRPYRTLAFATHGLLAQQAGSVTEPALVLTPPETGTEMDDGLLTASEIARLGLNAQWVILSACNTAASDGTPQARGLSGLARAFFYAGSRAVLVSHWAVSSEAAVALTTGTFRVLAENPGIGRAQALQRSMQALLKADDGMSHPMFWAPFVVAGDAR